jgi:hypothetical protein
MKNLFLLIIAISSNILFAQPNLSSKVTCSEKEEKIKGNSDPKIIKTCSYLNYTCISTSYPDYKGRYYTKYNWFKLNNGQLVKINNNELFNEKLNDLVELINQQIKIKFEELSSDPNNEDCLAGIENLPYYHINNLNIFMENSTFTFAYSLGITGACSSIDEDYVTFTIEYIKSFLKN